jgi:hypothetical protein
MLFGQLTAGGDFAAAEWRSRGARDLPSLLTAKILENPTLKIEEFFELPWRD